MGLLKDDIESVEWIRKAAEQGLTEAQQWLGICYNNGTCGAPQDDGESAKWFRKRRNREMHTRNTVLVCFSKTVVASPRTMSRLSNGIGWQQNKIIPKRRTT